MIEQSNRLPSDDARWHSVLARDAGADGAFVYAVSTTGVYCRPSCPSRRPRRANVAFFPIPEAAEGAGFRACRRCRPHVARAADPKLGAVRRACAFIEGETERKPTLAELAARVGLSPHHLQRVFTAVMGISPRAYAEALRFGRFRGAVKAGEAVAPALYGAGFGSSSRLYEKAAGRLGMTPATYAKGGKGAHISYALAPSPLGRLLVAATQAGVCMVSLGSRDSDIVAALRAEFPHAWIARDEGDLTGEVGAVLAHLEGREPHVDLALDVRATAFQWRVWGSLRAIPPGETRSYAALARAIGRPQAARAVGRGVCDEPRIRDRSVPPRRRRGREAGGISLGRRAQEGASRRRTRARRFAGPARDEATPAFLIAKRGGPKYVFRRRRSIRPHALRSSHRHAHPSHGRLGAGLGHDPRVAREGAPETAARGARRADAGRHRHHPGGGAQRGGKALLAAVTPRVRLPRAIRAAYKGRCSRSALSRVLTPNP